MARRMKSLLCVSVLSALCMGASLRGSVAPVADAAMNGNRERVAALLQSGADIDTAQGDGMTALHWAALRADVELARMLLQAGATVEATTRLGAYTPLLVAARQGSAALVAELLNAGADPNTATTNGTTALMFAAAAGSTDAIHAILDAGGVIDAKEIKGETALMFAAAYGRAGAVRALADRGAGVNAMNKAVDVTATAQAADAPAGATTGNNLRESGQVAAAQKVNPYNLLVHGQGGLTPLLFAARQGHTEVVRALLTAGADLDQASGGDRTTPLLMAIINGHFDLAMYLLERGASPNLHAENGVTPLFAVLNCYWAPRAAYPQPRAYEQQRTTYLDLMAALLDRGADPNARVKKKPWYSGYNFDRSGINEAGATAFWRAAYAGDVDAMRLLVSRGADPNIWTMKMPGRAGAAQESQRAGSAYDGPAVPVGAPDVSPLHAAAGVGYGVGYSGNSHNYHPVGMLPAVKYMVEELQVDVNAVDSLGNNAIHHAAARGDTEMVLYLVSKGANPLLINREGLTTVDMANAPVQKTTPFPETIALLMKLGAKNNNRCMSC